MMRVKKGEDVRPFEKYHSNGQLAEEGLIVNNRPDGIWKYDGSILAKCQYNKDGEKLPTGFIGLLLTKNR